MKNIFKIITLCSLITLVACNNKKKDDSPVATTPNKDLLSSWTLTGNGLWKLRLDLAPDHNGTNFSLVYKFSDDSEVVCSTANFAGSEGSGSYTASGCVATQGCTAGTGCQSTAFGGTVFQSGAGGYYTNNGTSLTVCRTTNDGLCRVYQ